MSRLCKIVGWLRCVVLGVCGAIIIEWRVKWGVTYWRSVAEAEMRSSGECRIFKTFKWHENFSQSSSLTTTINEFTDTVLHKLTYNIVFTITTFIVADTVPLLLKSVVDTVPKNKALPWKQLPKFANRFVHVLFVLQSNTFNALASK